MSEWLFADLLLDAPFDIMSYFDVTAVDRNFFHNQLKV